MTGYNQCYHIRCVYRELQLPFIPFFSLSLAYVGNILVRRYRPLTPAVLFFFFPRTYPAVPFFAYPAVPYFFLLLYFLCSSFFFFLFLFFFFHALSLPSHFSLLLCRSLSPFSLTPSPAVPLSRFSLTTYPAELSP